MFAAVTVGAITGALRGIPGGPLGMIGSAVFGAGMAAAENAMVDAAQIADND